MPDHGAVAIRKLLVSQSRILLIEYPKT